jgi:membrane protease YdiL (CAAX protease family)
MKKAVLLVVVLTGLAALAEGIILLQVRLEYAHLLGHVPLNPWQMAAVIETFALVLGAFVALSHPAVVRQLRQWAVQSVGMALGLPFSLLGLYLLYAFGTGTFSVVAAGKLLAYIAVPTLLLLPDRLHKAERAGWRDFAAMLALAFPVPAHWLSGVWMLPPGLDVFHALFGVRDLYVFLPLTCVCVGAYDFIVIRNLDGVGYRLVWRKSDVVDGSANFAAFSLLGIPLGMALSFIHPHFTQESLWNVPLQFVGIYVTIAIPEELLFRGILQNFLVRSIRRGPRGLYGLIIASVVFGLSHLHHAPVPNWRYAILATLAGLFYGNVYRTRQRLCASALTHALVDTVWRFWF